MATAAHGKIEEFQPQNEPFTAYLERVQLYFMANGVRAAKQVSVFLTVIGSKNYALLRNLLSPDLPQDKSLDELTAILKGHFEPKPVIIAERFYFHRRNQTVGETIADYVAELRRLTTHCEYGTHLEDAERNAKALNKPETAVQQVTTSAPPRRTTAACYRCGRPNHSPGECRFRETECNHCHKKGHIIAVSRARLSGKSSQQTKAQGQGQHRRLPPRRTKWVEVEDTSGGCEEEEELGMFSIGERSSAPLRVGLVVNRKQLEMELDTGAAVSIISETQRLALFDDLPLQESQVRLKAYTGHPLEVQGELNVAVRYGEQNAELTLRRGSS